MDVVNHFLKNQVDNGKTPSIHYCLFNAQSVLHRFAYGLADVRSGTPVSGESVYNLYSLTKTFTATAVMQLAESGYLDLDRPALDYLPWFPYGPEPTVRHLLTHTAGIANPMPLNWVHLVSGHDTFDEKAFFSEIFKKNAKLKHAPGTKFAYSNLGYVLLGQIVENVSGMPYDAYVRERIIRRLGVAPYDLDFAAHGAKRRVRGYHRRFSASMAVLRLLMDVGKVMEPSEGAWKPFKDMYVHGKAYGGLVGTVPALVRYAQAFLQPRNPLLKPESQETMFTENNVSDRKATGMCLGWYTGVLEGRRYVTHAGGGGGFYVEMRVYPESGLGSVLAFNRSGMTDERMLDKVDGLVFEHWDTLGKTVAGLEEAMAVR